MKLNNPENRHKEFINRIKAIPVEKDGSESNFYVSTVSVYYDGCTFNQGVLNDIAKYDLEPVKKYRLIKCIKYIDHADLFSKKINIVRDNRLDFAFFIESYPNWKKR